MGASDKICWRSHPIESQGTERSLVSLERSLAVSESDLRSTFNQWFLYKDHMANLYTTLSFRIKDAKSNKLAMITNRLKYFNQNCLLHRIGSYNYYFCSNIEAIILKLSKPIISRDWVHLSISMIVGKSVLLSLEE